MPELPEVEVVVRQLSSFIEKNSQIQAIQFLSPKLRTPLSLETLNSSFPLKVNRIYRRGKFIVMELDQKLGAIISHLGMTGSWRILTSKLKDQPNLQLKKHDHVVLSWKNNSYWVYNDARRFGVFEHYPSGSPIKWLDHLGVEPLDRSLSSEKFYSLIHKFQRPIKNVIMDSTVIVGVGNIYACEALFFAGIHPLTPSKSLTRKKSDLLFQKIIFILSEAIKRGGSTIKNFIQAQGESGSYQDSHSVYAREGEPCNHCGTIISRSVVAGRGTFWCSRCQK